MVVEQGIYFATWTLNVLFNLHILIKELKIRFTYDADENHQPLFVSRSMAVFSLSTLIFAVLWPLSNVLQRVNYICLYAAQASNILAAMLAISFNYYQLARLYYCFSATQAHSDKGYPNYVFYALYTLGFVLFVWSITSTWLVITTHLDPYGHQYFDHPPCHIEYSSFYIKDVIISTSIYYIETAAIISLYLVKIQQFSSISAMYVQKGMRSPRDSIIISQRIRFILNKIFVLTLCAEMSVTLFTVVAVIRQMMGSPVYMIVLQKICTMIASVGTSGSIYLMIEHNSNAYLAVLDRVDRIKICCCLRRFLDNARPNIEHWNRLKSTDGDDERRKTVQTTTITNTKTNTEVQEIDRVEESVMTVDQDLYCVARPKFNFSNV